MSSDGAIDLASDAGATTLELAPQPKWMAGPAASLLTKTERPSQGQDLARMLEDMLDLAGCLLELERISGPDRWRQETRGYEALARARRSLHRCVLARGL
ncbi:hypothetical protein SLNSH_10135 [Alsobacter soli]|uniref:Uncharacterized protein n=1 Tax=Alsobacter soli TaxID=2109933 RepID=A0A2T1HU44_9HYPH|nr:hypothetical protein [Alsobacter soli]PSC05164.1 hypothetical protein SLNSH_10135 [Alsobacter soli]